MFVQNLSPDLFYSPQLESGLPGTTCEPLFSPINCKQDNITMAKLRSNDDLLSFADVAKINEA